MFQLLNCVSHNNRVVIVRELCAILVVSAVVSLELLLAFGF